MRKGKLKLLAGLLSTVLVFTNIIPTGFQVSASEIEQEDSDVNTDGFSGESTDVAGDGAIEDQEEKDYSDEFEPADGEETEEEFLDDKMEDGLQYEGDEVIDKVEQNLNNDESQESIEEELEHLGISKTVVEDTATIEASGKCGANLTWTLENGTLTISGTGKMYNYSYDAGSPWKEYSDVMKNLVIMDGITSIGSYAFDRCSGFTGDLIIPNSVTSIGVCAFRLCSCLTSVIIPNSVTSIKDSTFNNCSSLTSVTIPNSVTSIGKSAFGMCSSLTSVTIPNSVTSIGEFAFVGCSSLPSVTIPNSVTSIGERAFSYCSSLTGINVTSGNLAYISVDGILFNPSQTLIHTYPAGKSAVSYSIPSSVTRIGGDAFVGCSLTSVIIPDSVTSIGEDAFEGCSNLTSVTIPDSVTSIGERAFVGCSNLTSVTIPNGITSIGEDTFWMCNSLTSVTIPDSVTSIGEGAFYECSNLASVTIPDSVTSIGESAFSDCSSLTSINVANGNLAYISVDGILFNVRQTLLHTYPAGKSAVSYSIPSSVTSIGGSAFEGCSLTSVTIPNGVTSIGECAFYECNSLTDVYYTGSEADWKAIKIGVVNDDLTNAAIHYNSSGPDNKLLYVQNLTKISLKNIDTDSRESINNAIYNLIFKAEYRPTESRIPNDTMEFTGTKDVIAKWPIQNKDYGTKAFWDKTVIDANLGIITFNSAAAGCMSYAYFASTYIYGTSGTKKISNNLNASGVREFIHQYADPGEHLRYEQPHSIVFLGESSDGDGFYYISYGGGVDGGKVFHDLYLAEYTSYESFASVVRKKGNDLYIYDTNGGSYYNGTARAVADVRSGNDAAKIVTRIACPVEATIELNGEILDSRSLDTASFGTVERDGDEIIFNLEYSSDYNLTITGTGEGSMTLTLEYYDSSESLIDKRMFVKMPIESSTEITSSGFDSQSTFVLYSADGTNEIEAWGAGINETVYSYDNLQRGDNKSEDDLSGEDHEITYTVIFDTQNHGIAPEAYTEVKENSKISEPQKPAEEGYRFTGWFKDEECTEQWDFESDTVQSDMTLYAGWEEDDDNDIASGSFLYDRGTWLIDSNGKLIVEGSGDFARSYSVDNDNYDRAPWYAYRDYIKSAEINITNLAQFTLDLSYMFYNCSNLISVDFINTDIIRINNMDSMFWGCSSLTSLDLSNFDTSNVSDMGGMFYKCSSLTNLDLSNFDTGNVSSMSSMFNGCRSLINLNLNGFDTGQLRRIHWMFRDCSSLAILDLSSFDGHGLIDDQYVLDGESAVDIFNGCDSLSTIYTPYNLRCHYNLPSNSGDIWYQPDGNKITELPRLSDSMIIMKNKIPVIDSPYITATIRKTNYVCNDYIHTHTLTVKHYNIDGTIKKVTDYTTNEDEIDMSTPGTKNLVITYDGLSTTIELTVSVVIVEAIEIDKDLLTLTEGSTATLFAKVRSNKATYSDITWASSDETVAKVEGESVGGRAFVYARNPGVCTVTASAGDKETVCQVIVFSRQSENDIAGGSYENVRWRITSYGKLLVEGSGDYAYMPPWYDHRMDIKTAEINLTDTTNAEYMFLECKNLISVNLSNFDTGKVTNMYGMFEGCSSLTNLDLSSFDTSEVCDMSQMFLGCSSLTNLDVSSFNTSKVTNMSDKEGGMFDGCSSLTSLDLSNFDTRNVYTMSYMFSDCKSLKSLNVSSFDTGNVEYMESMFEGCSSLTELDLSSFDISNVLFTTDMLSGCTELSTIYTPRNLQGTVTLPGNSGDIWCKPDGTSITELPKNNADSIVITKSRNPGTGDDDTEVKATEVTLDKTDLILANGTTRTLNITVTPSNFTDEVTWKSSNTSIVTVTDTGEVTAKGAGTATVTVTVGDVSASCTVTVVNSVISELSKTVGNLTDDEIKALDPNLLTVSSRMSAAKYTVNDQTIKATGTVKYVQGCTGYLGYESGMDHAGYFLAMKLKAADADKFTDTGHLTICYPKENGTQGEKVYQKGDLTTDGCVNVILNVTEGDSDITIKIDYDAEEEFQYAETIYKLDISGLTREAITNSAGGAKEVDKSVYGVESSSPNIIMSSDGTEIKVSYDAVGFSSNVKLPNQDNGGTLSTDPVSGNYIALQLDVPEVVKYTAAMKDNAIDVTYDDENSVVRCIKDEDKSFVRFIMPVSKGFTKTFTIKWGGSNELAYKQTLEINVPEECMLESLNKNAVSPASLAFNSLATTMYVGQSQKVSITIKKKYEQDTTQVFYTSSDSSVILVNRITGEIKALKAGTANITVTEAGNVEKPVSKSAKITVKNLTAPSSIKVSNIKDTSVKVSWKANTTGKFMEVYAIPYDKTKLGSKAAEWKSAVENAMQSVGMDVRTFDSAYKEGKKEELLSNLAEKLGVESCAAGYVTSSQSGLTIDGLQSQTEYIFYVRNISTTEASTTVFSGAVSSKAATKGIIFDDIRLEVTGENGEPIKPENEYGIQVYENEDGIRVYEIREAVNIRVSYVLVCEKIEAGSPVVFTSPKFNSTNTNIVKKLTAIKNTTSAALTYGAQVGDAEIYVTGKDSSGTARDSRDSDRIIIRRIGEPTKLANKTTTLTIGQSISIKELIGTDLKGSLAGMDLSKVNFNTALDVIKANGCFKVSYRDGDEDGSPENAVITAAALVNGSSGNSVKIPFSMTEPLANQNATATIKIVDMAAPTISKVTVRDTSAVIQFKPSATVTEKSESKYYTLILTDTVTGNKVEMKENDKQGGFSCEFEEGSVWTCEVKGLSGNKSYQAVIAAYYDADGDRSNHKESKAKKFTTSKPLLTLASGGSVEVRYIDLGTLRANPDGKGEKVEYDSRDEDGNVIGLDLENNNTYVFMAQVSNLARALETDKLKWTISSGDKKAGSIKASSSSFEAQLTTTKVGTFTVTATSTVTKEALATFVVNVIPYQSRRADNTNNQGNADMNQEACLPETKIELLFKIKREDAA